MMPERITLPEGAFDIPVRYDDVTTYLVVLARPLDSLQNLLPTWLRPQRLLERTGGLVLYFVDATSTGFGSYKEMALGVLCRDEATAKQPWGADLDWCPPPIFPIWFGVSAQLPLAAGRLVWGFPKTLEATNIERHETKLHCSVGSAASAGLKFTCHLPRDLAPRTVGLRSLTLVSGQICQTRVSGPTLFGELEAPCFELEAHDVFRRRGLDVPTRGEAISAFVLANQRYELERPSRAWDS